MTGTTTPDRVALFLDRDGVVNEPVWRPDAAAWESPLSVDDVSLTPGAAAAVRRARDHGLTVVIASNQPAAAKGSVSLDVLRATHAKVLADLADQDAAVAADYVCWHHPAGLMPNLTRKCCCRKPEPGLLLQAASDLGIDMTRSWLIGDTDADVGAARAAGLAGVAVVVHPRSTHRRAELSRSADLKAPDLPAAINDVLRLVGHLGRRAAE